MSRTTELKKQNQVLSMSIIDMFNLLTKKTKYTELFINLAKSRVSNYEENHRYHLISDLTRYFDEEYLGQLTTLELLYLHRSVVDFCGENNLDSFIKFIELNERKLIEKNDLTTYKDFDEINKQISLAEIKLMGKEIEKQIIKLFENDEWLVIKPMSVDASRKYGANTRWCTASKSTPEQFYNYSKRGILIYCINKFSGHKVAAFKNLDMGYDKKEISFWDVIDNRIDSLESDLDDEVLNIIRKEFRDGKLTNWELLGDEEKILQLRWMESEKKHMEEPDLIAITMPTEPVHRINETQLNYNINNMNIA